MEKFTLYRWNWKLEECPLNCFPIEDCPLNCFPIMRIWLNKTMSFHGYMGPTSAVLTEYIFKETGQVFVPSEKAHLLLIWRCYIKLQSSFCEIYFPHFSTRQIFSGSNLGPKCNRIPLTIFIIFITFLNLSTYPPKENEHKKHSIHTQS